MSAVSARDLSGQLSKQLASAQLSKAVVKRLAERVTIDGLQIGRFHPCIYGICVEYWTKEPPQFAVGPDRGIAKWEVFPYGIIDWDMFRVRVAFEVDELEGRVSPRGFIN